MVMVMASPSRRRSIPHDLCHSAARDSSRTQFLSGHGNERADRRIGISTDCAAPMESHFCSGEVRGRVMQAGDDIEHVLACSTTVAIAAPAYTMTARVLHWITAFLILAMIPLGVVIANEWG